MQVLDAVAPVDSRITNAAEASAIYFELDVTARLLRGLSVMAGFGYNHLWFDKFEDVNGNYEGNITPMPRNIPSTSEYSIATAMVFMPEQTLWRMTRCMMIMQTSMVVMPTRLSMPKSAMKQTGSISTFTATISFDEEYGTVGFSNGYYNLYSEPGAIGLQLNYRF